MIIAITRKNPICDPRNRVGTLAVAPNMGCNMSDNERRHLAAEFTATAQLITDLNIRTHILALAQKWLDLAERGSGELKNLEQTIYLRDIRTRIGQELRTTYD